VIATADRKEITRFGKAIALVESVSRRVKAGKDSEGFETYAHHIHSGAAFTPYTEGADLPALPGRGYS